jgi:pyruvate/2-oxoglutarate dehydrogenase complex dihydrolipoamide acyltransferase (E2) component
MTWKQYTGTDSGAAQQPRTPAAQQPQTPAAQQPQTPAAQQPPTPATQQPETPAPPASKRIETTSERYLRHIRNVVVAAFIIWIISGLAGGIAWVAIVVHAHDVAQQNACAAAGGIWLSGGCVGG